ncbi:hypothetical protein GCM10010129_68740 [Streptomyces fumigatiscleroticus]|nr:hypothetical protein GCM10010129_68740 [Streptomyces fumigatiscleroticus]
MPGTAPFAAEFRGHLDRLAEDLALDAPLRTGDLRTAFDRIASNGRLTQLPARPDMRSGRPEAEGPAKPVRSRAGRQGRDRTSGGRPDAGNGSRRSPPARRRTPR